MSAVVLDSGAVTRLASRDRLSATRIESLKRRGIWPPVVPSVVLVECLTGRQGIDAVTNRFLKSCDVQEQLPEQTARRAGRLRDRTGRASTGQPISTALLFGQTEMFAQAVPIATRGWESGAAAQNIR